MNTTIVLPDYTIGPNALEEIPKICTSYGKNVVIVGGKTALKKAGEKLTAALQKGGFTVVNTLWYGKDCTPDTIAVLAQKTLAAKADFLIGVGGGKALDTAKGAANQIGIPVFCVPTIASTCAATTKLSVVYNEEGVFQEFYFFQKPAVHTFIDTEIIAKAPDKYLRAGIGDTMAKHYECTFASKNDQLDHSSGVAREISNMCVTPMFPHAKKALTLCKENKTGFALDQVILSIIVTTGLVSMLIEEKYNGALAHSIFYALTLLPHIEENYLHGDVVAYGVLVQLSLDNQEKLAKECKEFFKDLRIPTTLKDIEVPLDKKVLQPILENIFTQPDMADIPYPITEEMVWEAMKTVEGF